MRPLYFRRPPDFQYNFPPKSYFLWDENNIAQISLSSEVFSRGKFPPLPGNLSRLPDYLIVSIAGLDAAQRDELIRKTKLVEFWSAEMGELVVEDEDGKQWYVKARPIKHIRELGRDIITFEVPDRVWRAKTRSSYSWTMTSDTESAFVETYGNYPALPVIQLTPRQKKTTGFQYRQFVAVYNPLSEAVVNYPLMIGPFDSSSLISNNKAQSTGNDLWVFVNGAASSRWLKGWNTTSTYAVIPISLSPKIELTLGSPIGTGTIGEISVTKDRQNFASLLRLKEVRNKLLLIDSELFTFTSVAPDEYKIKGVSRAKYGSSATSHNVGTTIRWVEHNIWLVYGDPAASAPENRPEGEPIIDLTNSTPTTWVYSVFYDAVYPDRPGSWSPRVLRGGEATMYYTGPWADPTVNPAEVMGAYAEGEGSGRFIAEVEWRFETPVGATRIIWSGRKRRSGEGFSGNLTLEKSTTGSTFKPVQIEFIDSQTGWVDFSYDSSLIGTYPVVRFRTYGDFDAAPDQTLSFEVDTATVYLDSTRVPQTLLLPEQDAYWYDLDISTSVVHQVYIRGLSGLNEVLVIDTDQKMITLDGVPAFYLLEKAPNENWLEINYLETEVTFEDPGTVSLEVQITWEDRKA